MTGLASILRCACTDVADSGCTCAQQCLQGCRKNSCVQLGNSINSETAPLNALWAAVMSLRGACSSSSTPIQVCCLELVCHEAIALQQSCTACSPASAEPACSRSKQDGSAFVDKVLARLAEAYCSILGIQSSLVITGLSKHLRKAVLHAFQQARLDL